MCSDSLRPHRLWVCVPTRLLSMEPMRIGVAAMSLSRELFLTQVEPNLVSRMASSFFARLVFIRKSSECVDAYFQCSMLSMREEE